MKSRVGMKKIFVLSLLISGCATPAADMLNPFQDPYKPEEELGKRSTSAILDGSGGSSGGALEDRAQFHRDQVRRGHDRRAETGRW